MPARPSATRSVRKAIQSAKKTVRKARKTSHTSPHRSFRLTPRSSYRGGKKPAKAKVARSFTLMKRALSLVFANKRIFFGMTLLYLLFSWLFIGLPDASQYVSVRELLDASLGGDTRSFTGFVTLMASAANGLLSPVKSDLAQALTALAALIFTVSFIWVARQRLAGNTTGMREALYNAPAPLVVLIILLALLGLQLVPGAIGLLLLSYTIGIQAASLTGPEAVMLALAGGLLVVLSLYMLAPTIVALVVATLPNTYPLAALRSGALLTYQQRGTVLLRLAGMVLLLAVLWLVLLVPAVLFELFVGAPEWLPLIQIVLDLATALSLPLIALYVYLLYRELL